MTTPLDEIPPEMLRDSCWVELLPWLAAYAPGTSAVLAGLSPAPDWWLAESPAVTSTVVDLSTVCAALGRLLVSDHLDLLFSDALPTLPADLPLNALDLSTRARTTMQRIGAATVADLGAGSSSDLFAVRGTGAGTVQEVVTTLIIAAVVRRPETVTASPTFQDVPAATAVPDASLTPVLIQLLEDLGQLAVWRHVRGHPDEPLVRVEVEEGAPEEIQELALRTSSVSLLSSGVTCCEAVVRQVPFPAGQGRLPWPH